MDDDVAREVVGRRGVGQVRYLVVSVGRNPGAKLSPCLESIRMQTTPNVEVCCVDDASTDDTATILKEYQDLPGWQVIVNEERKWAMANQVTAWRAMEPEDDDVICFVDLDDALAFPDALRTLDRYYDQGAWMTYGSYRPVPGNHPSARTCHPARPYPPYVITYNAYRKHMLLFNHLRTVSWKVLKNLTEEDLRDDSGNYWTAIMDPAVMIPCMELSNRHTVFVKEVLYLYTCDGADAVWRTMQKELKVESDQFYARAPKVPL